MKVCILTPEFLPAWGGIGTYTYNLARGLRDRAEVHVLTGAANPEYAELDGVRVHHALPGDGLRAPTSPFRFQAAVFRRLPRLAKTYGFDIVHANHAYMSDLLSRLRGNRTPTVVTVRRPPSRSTRPSTRRSGGPCSRALLYRARVSRGASPGGGSLSRPSSEGTSGGRRR